MNGRNGLSPRLRMVADLVPRGARLADIGTDHAYLPVALLQEEQIPFAIAADLRMGPLSRAKETVRASGLTDKVAFRLCDGLTGIRPDEVDAVVIAGMGGETIAGILDGAAWVRERDIPLVLQPMSSMPELRGWLGDNGYQIVCERLAREGDVIYTAFSAAAGEMGTLSAAQRYVGRNSADPLRGPWLEHWLGRIQRALDGLARAKGEQAGLRRRELEQVRQELIEMEQEWDAWQQ